MIPVTKSHGRRFEDVKVSSCAHERVRESGAGAGWNQAEMLFVIRAADSEVLKLF